MSRERIPLRQRRSDLRPAQAEFGRFSLARSNCGRDGVQIALPSTVTRTCRNVQGAEADRGRRPALSRAKLGLLQLAIETLTAAVYVHIGMDHFALPEDELALARSARRMHRNFMGYTTHADSDLSRVRASARSAYRRQLQPESARPGQLAPQLTKPTACLSRHARSETTCCAPTSSRA